MANFCFKISILEFLGIDNLHKKFGDDISKLVDFIVLSNFWWSFLHFLKNKKRGKKEVMTTKSYTLEKNPQFSRYHLQIFCASCLHPKT